MSTINKQIHLVARPVGEPTEACFALVEKTLGEPGPGQVLVKNEFLSSMRRLPAGCGAFYQIGVIRS